MDLMLPTGRLYHHAYVVPDLEEAMDRLGTIFNMEWAPVALRHHHVVADGYEVTDVDFRLTYSTTGPPHIEIVEGVPGSIWPRPEEITFHHVGLWASDLRTDAQRYEDLGLPIVAHGTSQDGEFGRFTYHSNPFGPWIELVDPAVRDPFERWMSGEPFVT